MLPSQTVIVCGGVVITVAGLITTVVDPGALVQPLTVTVTLYVPAAAAVALVMDGFCEEDVNPLGPVQL